MSKRKNVDVVNVNLFLFYIKNGVELVKVDTLQNAWRNIWISDKSLAQTLDWLLKRINNHVHLLYYRIPDNTKEEYVFFAHMGKHNGRMEGLNEYKKTTVEAFWDRAQTCLNDEFSISASLRMSMGEALGVFRRLGLPAFTSKSPYVPQYGEDDVKHIVLHEHTSESYDGAPDGSRSIPPLDRSSYGMDMSAQPPARMSLSAANKEAIDARRAAASARPPASGMTSAADYGIGDERMLSRYAPKITPGSRSIPPLDRSSYGMDMSAQPPARMSLSVADRAAVRAAASARPPAFGMTSAADSGIGNERMLSPPEITPGSLKAKHSRFTMPHDTAAAAETLSGPIISSPSEAYMQAHLAKRAAHLQKTAAYTPEQQEDIWVARMMRPDIAYAYMQRRRLPISLLDT